MDTCSVDASGQIVGCCFAGAHIGPKKSGAGDVSVAVLGRFWC